MPRATAAPPTVYSSISAQPISHATLFDKYAFLLYTAQHTFPISRVNGQGYAKHELFWLNGSCKLGYSTVFLLCLSTSGIIKPFTYCGFFWDN